MAKKKKSIPASKAKPVKPKKVVKKKKVAKKPAKKSKKKGGKPGPNKNTEYFKLFYVLKGFYQKHGVKISAVELKRSNTLLYDYLKEHLKKQRGRKSSITAKALRDIFSPKHKIEVVWKLFARLGMVFPSENFLYWQINDYITLLPKGTYVEINIEYVGEPALIIGNVEDIDVAEIFLPIRAYLREHADTLNDNYLWFRPELTKDGWYYELFYDSGLAEEQIGKAVPGEAEQAVPPEEPTGGGKGGGKEPADDKELLEIKKEKEREEVRKVKIEADTKEVEKLRKILDGLNDQYDKILNLIAKKKKAKLNTKGLRNQLKDIEGSMDEVNKKLKKLI